MDRFPEVGSLELVSGPALELEGVSLAENLELGQPQPNKSNRVKCSCPGCRVNIWGKPDLNLTCNDCELVFNPQ